MPKELTHWILAEQAMAGLGQGSRLREIIAANHDVYLAGAVLPDTLLYLFRGAHSAVALDLANRFHDTAGNSFAPLIRAEERYGGELPAPLMACLLGVISHMKADIVFHPFVYAHAGKADIGRHYRLETDMDLYFLGKGMEPPRRLLKEMLSAGNRESVIDACALIFDPDGSLPREALEHALGLHCRIQAMYCSAFWKLAALALAALFGGAFAARQQLFYPLAGSSATAAALGQAGEWRHPVSGRPQHESLDDLAVAAIQETVRIFNLIEAEGAMSAALTESTGENLLTGMCGVCEGAMNV